MASAIPPHVTLLPPTAIGDDTMGAFLEHLRVVTAGVEPFRMVLSGTGTFRPVSPVVFVQVSLGIAQCEALERAVRSGPVERRLDFPYHPHVTVAHHLGEDALDRAFADLGDFRCDFRVGSVELYTHDEDGVWRVQGPFPSHDAWCRRSRAAGRGRAGGRLGDEIASRPMSSIPGFWALVPAGGAGTRLWPLSRAGHPKFLLDLTGSGRSLLQATVDRLQPLTGDRVIVVTGTAHADAVRAQLPGLGRRAGARRAVAARLDGRHRAGRRRRRARGPGCRHRLVRRRPRHPRPAAFETVIREAADVARDGHLVTIGIEPTCPATGFGYIRAGERLAGAATALHAVEFVEKPDAVRAAEYVASGDFRWNAGMFVVRASVLLDLLGRWHPELAAGVRAIAADPSRLDEVWPGLTKIAIDHAVAEPAADAGHVVVVPAPFAWDDVGDFASLAALLPHG